MTIPWQESGLPMKQTITLKQPLGNRTLTTPDGSTIPTDKHP